MIDGITNDRVASAPLPSRERSQVVALAMGERKLPGIRAAVTRRLVNGLITDERTAAALLAAELRPRQIAPCLAVPARRVVAVEKAHVAPQMVGQAR